MRLHLLALATLLIGSFHARPVRCETSDPAVALSESEGWLRLGHYQKSWLGNYKSLVTTESFFLSPEGRTSPRKELEATIEAFRSPKTLALGPALQPAECAFPARRAWLVQQGVPLPALKEKCTDRQDWIAGIGAVGITLVFSSAYPNNPASMFGHTLLMFNHASRNSILNYGANFEAAVGTEDPAFIYGFKGLFGLYRGGFSIAPYYTKINEYNYAESRDLWEYELNLTQAEVNTAVNHLWELFSVGGFDYHFLDENCSYQLLALLEVAKPEWELTSGFSAYALPLDTLKKVAAQKGAIRSERMRASLFRNMNAEVARLSDEQKKLRKEILSGEKPVSEVADVSSLESVLTFLDYRRRGKDPIKPAQQQLLNSALYRRAQLGAPPGTETAAVENPGESPLKSHGSRALFPGFLQRGDHSRLSLGGRLGLHDVLDPEGGYPDGFLVDLFRLRLTVGLEAGDKKLRLDEFQLAELLSLYPVNSLDPQISWNLRIGTGTRLDFGEHDSLGTIFEGGPGYALKFGNGDLWLYGLGLFTGEILPNTPKGGRYGVGGEAGLKAKLGRVFQLKAESRYRLELNRPWNRSGYWEHGTQASATLHQDLQLRAGMRTTGKPPGGKARIWEWSSELRWYF